MDLDELKDEKFPALVATASRQLSDDQRLVIVIDALDEGIGAEKESVPSCIPAGDYPGVVFLLSYRVDVDAQNSRVADQPSTSVTTACTRSKPLTRSLAYPKPTWRTF